MRVSIKLNIPRRTPLELVQHYCSRDRYPSSVEEVACLQLERANFDELTTSRFLSVR